MFNLVISFENKNLNPVIDAFGFGAGNLFLSPETSEALITGLLQAILPREPEYRSEVILIASRHSETRFFKHHEVLYIESVGNLLQINTGREAFAFYGRMYNIEKIMESLGFVRVHHAFIVSPEHILSCNSRSIQMDDGREICIGKTYRQHFRAFMKERYRTLK